jgi:hypothetical protein
VRWSEYEQLFRWIRENTAAEDVLASGLDSMLYLYTDRQAVKAFESRPRKLFYGEKGAATGTVDDLMSILNQHGAQFLVKHPMPGFADEQPLNQLIEEAVRMVPSCLREAYHVPEDTRFVIYEVRLSSCSATAASLSPVVPPHEPNDWVTAAGAVRPPATEPIDRSAITSRNTHSSSSSQ